MEELILEIKNKLLSLENKEEIKDFLNDYHDSDIADALEDMTEEERLRVYNKLGVEKLSDIFAYYENVEDYIEEVTPDLAADIIQEMDTNEAIDVLNELDEEDKQEIIELMEEEAQESVLTVDSYDEEEIGSYMSDNFIVLNINDTIAIATKKMIKEAGEHDNLYTLYVVNDNNEYCGAVNVRDLIVARKSGLLSDIIMDSYPSFNDKELMSDCISRLKDYSEDSVPVLNEKHNIVGVITSDIVIDATEEEVSEDYAKLAGLTNEEDIDESVGQSVKKRIPWLIVLLFLGLVVSSVTGSFEGVIGCIPAVIFFQTMILGMSGNVGTQSLGVTIRNLSSGESKKKLAKNIFKEIGIGLLNGIIVAVIAFLFVLAFMAIKQQEAVKGNGYIFIDSLKVSAIIGISMLLAMTVSNLIGALLPILLHKIHIDPAAASGPFITTINDIVAISIYYGLTFLLFSAYII